MPVRSLTQSLLRWPSPDQVLAEVAAWAAAQQAQSPSLQRIGVFGSYGRSTAGVGSDLDLLIVDASADGPQYQRLLRWPLEQLPLSCDALVLTAIELEELLASGSRMAQELQRDLLWLRIIQTPGASGTALSGQCD
jgi:predicted nucleotidyltransferase